MSFRVLGERRAVAASAFLAVFLLNLFALSTVSAADSQEEKAARAVAALTDGVSSIPPRGLPGPIATLGDSAFPVVVGRYENGVSEPVVSGAFVEKGRVVAFGHTDYVDAASIEATSDSTKFFSNALRWAAFGGEKKESDLNADSKIRVAVWRNQETAQALQKLGFDAVSVDVVPDKFDVFVAGAANLNDAEYARIFDVVRGGAGFVTCGLGWGWSQLNPGKNLVFDHSGNRNFAKFGVALAWTDGTLETTKNGEFEVGAAFSPFVSGGETARFVGKIADAKAAATDELAALGAVEARQISSTSSLIYRFLAKKERVAFDRLANSGADEIVPTAKNPIKNDDLIRRLTIAIQLDHYLDGQALGETAAKDVPAFAAGNDFPGPVPTDSPRLNAVKIAVKTAVPDWRSTGLYAAPGETITVRVDVDALKKFKTAPKIRIGAHSDELWKLERWERYPKITLEKPIVGPKMEIANPFGGPIYVVMPRGAERFGLDSLDVEISGAVAAPYFVRDETSLDDWKTTIRNAPGPWAELQGKRITLTVPSSVVRELDDPQALMETWDEILGLIADFSSTPRDFVRPERFCCDRQISAGYMHNGYPAMSGLDVENVFVDRERLTTKGDWGFFHEMGHNFQSGYWTFEGSGEVTVNYFSLYVLEKYCGLCAEETRGELKKDARIELLRQYKKLGGSFDVWKRNPFLALNMTVQLRNEFGWEPFIAAIAEYRTAAPGTLPKNDDEKRDQWLVRLSRQIGKNLGPFFEKWGVPTSQEARDSLNDLPVWISSEFDELEKSE